MKHSENMHDNYEMRKHKIEIQGGKKGEEIGFWLGNLWFIEAES